MIGDLVPRAWHRLGLRLAHGVRHRWRRLRKAPLRGCSMIARNQAGEVLLVRHSYGPPGWYVPGGGLGRHEDPREGAIRELLEEVNCEAQQVEEVAQLEDEISGSPHTAFIFMCQIDEEPQADGREIIEARFFAPDALPDELSPMARERLSAWLSKMPGQT